MKVKAASAAEVGIRRRAEALSTDHHLWKIWVRAYLLGPERWWSMPEQGEARGNSGGGS